MIAARLPKRIDVRFVSTNWFRHKSTDNHDKADTTRVAGAKVRHQDQLFID
jgi:hypothetical protein